MIDVLKNFRPKQDLILVKTKHPRLEITKVVAGMSGSPIYLNDKMIGAYAYGWSFGSEPVAGVTPIRNMLDELARPLPDHIDGWPLQLLPQAVNTAPRERHANLDSESSLSGRPRALRSAREHAAQLALALGVDASHGVSALTPVSTPILDRWHEQPFDRVRPAAVEPAGSRATASGRRRRGGSVRAHSLRRRRRNRRAAGAR